MSARTRIKGLKIALVLLTIIMLWIERMPGVIIGIIIFVIVLYKISGSNSKRGIIEAILFTIARAKEKMKIKIKLIKMLKVFIIALGLFIVLSFAFDTKTAKLDLETKIVVGIAVALVATIYVALRLNYFSEKRLLS